MKKRNYLPLFALLTSLPGCDPPPAQTVAKTAAAQSDLLKQAAPLGQALATLSGEDEGRWWTLQPAAAFRRVDTDAKQERRWERVTPTPPQIETHVVSGYHRYRGTLAGQKLTLELTTGGYSGDGFSRAGHYYFDREGQPHTLLVPEKWDGNGWFRLLESTGEYEGDTLAQVADWYARHPLGPRMSGQRVDRRTGRSQPFELREDYTRAVRYEIISEEIRGDTIWRDFGDGELTHRYYSDQQQLLHLLGPDTLRPALRRLQCPPPRQRHTSLRQELAQERENPGYQAMAGGETYLEVEYNGSGILSVLHGYLSHLGRASNNQECIIYDLTTGRQQRVADWLRPDQKTAVLALLTRQARQDPDYQPPSPANAPRELPELGMDSEGVYCTLGDLAPGIHEIIAGKAVRISFTALAPYVRPGTPLARLLLERKIVPVGARGRRNE